MIYELVKYQIRTHNGANEIDAAALAATIDFYRPVNKQDCFERVLAAGRDLLNR